jgi:subtilisin family serine protease
MRKKEKIVISIIFLVFIALLVMMFSLKSIDKKKHTNEHRRQSWLSSINWDTNRSDYTGKGITVAIIDTGISEDVPEFKDSIKEYKSFTDNKTQDNKHGTAVAGIIAGKPQNEKQILGIAYNTKIISIDVYDDEKETIEVDSLVQGINYAVKKKVDIINISIGCMKSSSQLEKAIKNAISNDILVIASAGNYVEDEILYPAKYEDVISVGSTNKKNEIISPRGNLEKKVLYFPGESIVTCIGKQEYAGCEGTSFSTAICTGLASLLLEKKNDKDEVRKYLQNIDCSEKIDFIEIINNY